MQPAKQRQRSLSQPQARFPYGGDDLARAGQQSDAFESRVRVLAGGSVPRQACGRKLASSPSERHLVDHQLAEFSRTRARLAVGFEPARMRERADWKLRVEQLEQAKQPQAVV